MSSRVERMFGPRESWGKGDEMDRVRERAVRQEGGGPEIDRHCEAAGRGNPVMGKKKAPSVAARQLPHAERRGAKGNGTGAVPYGANGAKEAKKAGFNRDGGAWGGLAGFVSIRCGCGKVVHTCLRQRTPVVRCRDCGGETDLAHVSNIHMKCARCGFTGKYRTNRTEEKIQMECLNCSDIVCLTKIRRGNYVVEGEQAAGEGM